MESISAFLSWNLSGGRWIFLASGPRMLCSWGGIVESCGEQLRCRQWDRAKATCFLVARSQPLWRCESLWYISEKSCKRDCPPICYIRTDMDGSSLWRLVHFESFGSISTWPSSPAQVQWGCMDSHWKRGCNALPQRTSAATCPWQVITLVEVFLDDIQEAV